MYSFAQRSDTTVVDEPFYASYLTRNPHVYRRYRDELLKVQSSDPNEVIAQLKASSDKPMLFAKHIAKQQPPLQFEATRRWLLESSNVLLIREPKRVLTSWQATTGQRPTLADSGFQDLVDLLPYADAVVQNEDLLMSPEGTLRALCARLKIDWHRSMLSWPKGMPLNF
jgi:hypothetical protein